MTFRSVSGSSYLGKSQFSILQIEEKSDTSLSRSIEYGATEAMMPFQRTIMIIRNKSYHDTDLFKFALVNENQNYQDRMNKLSSLTFCDLRQLRLLLPSLLALGVHRCIHPHFASENYKVH